MSIILILLFKLLTQFPFVSFLSISILSLLPFSTSSTPSLLSLLINSLSSYDRDFNLLHSFTNGTYFCIPFHTMTYFFFNNAFYELEKTKFLCLSSNLSYPEDLKKQFLPFSILTLLPFLISPSSCSSDQFSVLLR